MTEGRCGQAPEVDHVRAFLGEGPRLAQDALDRELGRIDDLREDPDVMAREIDAEPRLAEMRGDVVEIVGPARDRNAPLRRERVEIAGAEPRHEDAIGLYV